jgi:hypothetical protein
MRNIRGRIRVYRLDRSIYFPASQTENAGSTPVFFPSDPTFIDPAAVTTEHCYASRSEYYFLSVASATEIQLATGAGTCPAVFPSTNATNYCR